MGSYRINASSGVLISCSNRATYSLGDFEAVLDAISTGKIKPAGMITKKIRLDKVVDEGFHALINDKENQVKILVDVGAGLS